MAAAFDIVRYGPNMYFVGGELDMATAPMLEAALELVRLVDQPNIHVDPCAADPYPVSQAHPAWAPPEDIAVRLEALRARHQSSGPT